ncbi:MAG: MFS transporter [Actinobacteria bacterium]|nr:MFS transporter [Actinomycetota bacterium]
MGRGRRDASSSGANWVLAMVITTTGLSGLALSIMIVAFPAIRADFPGASVAQLSWINNLFTIVSAAVIVPCGVLADRLGRKRMMLVGAALFTVGSVVGALAPSPAWIMVGRTIMALGAASFGPAGMALLVSVFPPERIVFAISIWSISGGISSSIGPSLGGMLIDHLGWRWAFWINLPLCAVTLALGPFVLRETARDRTKRLPDLVGAALMIAATSAITFAVVQRKTDPGWGWLGTRTLACVAVGVVIGALFVLRCQRTARPLVHLDLLRSPRVTIGAFGMFVQNLGFFAVYWALVQHTVNEWGWTAARAGIASIPVSLVSGMVAFGTSRVADRVGPRPVVLASSVGQILSFVFMWFAISETESFAAVVVGATLLGATSGLAVPTLASLTLRGLPPDQHAFGSAFNSMAQRIGSTFGTSLAITLIASEAGIGSLHHTLVAGVVAVGLMIPLGLRSGRADR